MPVHGGAAVASPLLHACHTQVYELWAMVAMEHGLFQEAAAIMEDRKKVSCQGWAAFAMCAL